MIAFNLPEAAIRWPKKTAGLIEKETLAMSLHKRIQRLQPMDTAPNTYHTPAHPSYLFCLKRVYSQIKTRSF
jgi:hypothetical protein